jgi:hypothetical protein
MNKLYEKNRFDDIIRVYEKLESLQVVQKGDYIHVDLLLDALVEKVKIISKKNTKLKDTKQLNSFSF